MSCSLKCQQGLGLGVSILLLTEATVFRLFNEHIFALGVSNEKEPPGTPMLRTNTQASFTVTPMTLWLQSHSLKITWSAQ